MLDMWLSGALTAFAIVDLGQDNRRWIISLSLAIISLLFGLGVFDK